MVRGAEGDKIILAAEAVVEAAVLGSKTEVAVAEGHKIGVEANGGDTEEEILVADWITSAIKETSGKEVKTAFKAEILEQIILPITAERIRKEIKALAEGCLLYTSPSPRDRQKSRMPSSA